MRKLNSSINVDNSDLANYPDGRIKNNTGTGNGTPVNEIVYGDVHQTRMKLMRLYGIEANGLPDNETNGFQEIESLRALATKNDFILPITLASGVLNVPIKLGFMLENEQVVCKAGVDYDSETQIKGLDATTFSASVLGSFKVNEYVRLIKTASGIVLVRLADNTSLDSMVGFLEYLKKATQTEENAGLIETKSTTPLSNLTAFVRRVIGVDSGSYLATAIRNGLYPKEHFEIVENIGDSPVKNIGWCSGVDIGGMTVGASLPVSGDITSAVVENSGQVGNTQIILKMANAMANTNYFVRIHIQSEGTFGIDNDLYPPVFKTTSTTQFQIMIAEPSGGVQNLKFHFEVVQI